MTEQARKSIIEIIDEETTKSKQLLHDITELMQDAAKICNNPINADCAEWQAYQVGRISGAMNILKHLGHDVLLDKEGYVGEKNVRITTIRIDGEEIFHD